VTVHRRIAAVLIVLAALAVPATATAAWRAPSKKAATAHRHGQRRHRAKRRVKRHPAPHRAVTRPASVIPVRRPAPAAPSPQPAAAPATAPAAPATCSDTDTMPTTDNLDAIRAAIGCLVDNQRIQAGLAPLSDNAQLQAAAQGHSEDMVARGYFDHTTPDGQQFSDRIFASGYVSPSDSYWMGENIAWGGGSFATPSQIVQAWMNSPGHRANILSSTFRDAGVGVAIGSPGVAGAPGGATYTQDFGRR